MGVVVGVDHHTFRMEAPRLFSRSFDYLFLLFVFVTIFLPSGTVFGINIKLPLYAALLPLAFFLLFKRRKTSPQELILLLGAPAVLAFWILVGQANGFALAGALRQYTDIMLMWLLCWLAFLFCEKDVSRHVRFLRLIVSAELACASLKGAMVLYALLRGIPVVQVVEGVSHVFGVTLMTMDLGALFGRIQFVSDVLIPICIFLTLRHRDRLGFGTFRATFTVLVLAGSVVLGFSRFFWGFSVFAFVVGLLLGRRDRFQMVLFSTLILGTLLSLPVLFTLYQLRFSEAVAGSSDRDRVEQQQALRNFFLDAPIFGHGLGSFSHAVIRENENEAGRYGYEMQLLALSGQLGILGIVLMSGFVIWCYRRLFWKRVMPIRNRIGLGGMLLFWLAAGLYNPMLLNAVAGVAYSSLATLVLLEGEDPAPGSHVRRILRSRLSTDFSPQEPDGATD